MTVADEKDKLAPQLEEARWRNRQLEKDTQQLQETSTALEQVHSLSVLPSPVLQNQPAAPCHLIMRACWFYACYYVETLSQNIACFQALSADHAAEDAFGGAQMARLYQFCIPVPCQEPLLYNRQLQG